MKKKTPRAVVNGLTIYVYNGYEVKEELKKKGFKFEHDSRSWYYTAKTPDEIDSIMGFLRKIGVETPEAFLNKLQDFYEQLIELYTYYKENLLPEMKENIKNKDENLEDLFFYKRICVKDDPYAKGFTTLGKRNLMMGFLVYLKWYIDTINKKDVITD